MTYASAIETGDVKQIWNGWLDAIKGSFGFSYAELLLVEGENLVLTAFHGVEVTPDVKLPLRGKGVTVRAARTGETQLVTNTQADPDYIPIPPNSLSELAIPLMVEGKVYGVVNIESELPNAFNKKDQKLMQLLVSELGLSVEILMKGSKLKTLYKYTNRLNTVNSSEELSLIISEALKEICTAQYGSFSQVIDDELHFQYIYGGEVRPFKIPLSGRAITARAARTGESQLIYNVELDPDYLKPEDFVGTTRSELAVPVKANGRVLAVINIEKPEVGGFSKTDAELCEILGNHLSSTLLRIKENDEKNKYRQQLELLHQLVLQLDQTKTSEEVFDVSANILKRFFTDYNSFGLVRDGFLVPIKPVAPSIPTLPINGRGISVRAVREAKTQNVGDTSLDPDYVIGSFNAISELVVPLKMKDKVIGIINLESSRRNAYSIDDVKLVEVLAAHMVSTLDRINIYDAQRRASEELIRAEAKAEETRQLADAKARFLSIATHEIRTPLTSILGYIDLADDSMPLNTPPETLSYLKAVKRNAKRLEKLTDDLLESQRIEMGRIEISKSRGTVKTLIDDLTEEASPTLKSRRQTLRFHGNSDITISVDHNRILQVLANLVSNASKFSPEDSSIWVSASEMGGDIVFMVRDEGVGIREEDIKKLFKPFPDIKVEGNREGTGLGLSICKGIIDLHGGRIWAESGGPGKGSTFCFTVPRENYD